MFCFVEVMAIEKALAAFFGFSVFSSPVFSFGGLEFENTVSFRVPETTIVVPLQP